MSQVLNEAKLLGALLGVLKKESSKVRDELLKELREELNNLEPLLVEGPEGPEGPEGSIGPRGLLGEQGPAGPQGELGPIGSKGDTGDIGEKGDKGDRGEAGPVGPQGLQGETGPQGIEGKIGPEGARGEKGEKGDRGDVGPVGPQGLQGEIGPEGPQGIQGLEGRPGSDGAKGEKGDRGLQGLQGVKGDKGDKGDTGPAGPQGEPGEPGRDGETPDVAPIEKNLNKLFEDLKGSVTAQVTRLNLGGGSSSGGGEVRLEFLDDVDRDTAKIDGRYLKFDAATGKFVGATVSEGGGATSYNELDDLPNLDQYLQVANLTSINSNIVPTANNVYDLGTTDLRWRDLFLSGQTINLGGATISSDGTGQIAISATGAILPANSRITTAAGATEKSIAVIGAESGAVEIEVPLYTQTSGLKTAANTFLFRVDSEVKVFNNFFLNSGARLDSAAKIAQFLF
jgi:hypothetical protein